MPLFQLTMRSSPQSAPETLQFIAGDMSSALAFANRHASSLPAELWSDGRRVCWLEYDEDSAAWVVVDPAETISAKGRT